MLVREAYVPADVADIRVGEGRDELAQGLRRPDAVGIREGEDLAPPPIVGGVLGPDLAAAREIEHDVRARLASELDGAVP